MVLAYNEKTGEVEILIESKWITKEESKEMWPDNPNQPDSSKREDLSNCSHCKELEEACGNCFSQDGFCPKCGRLIRCGTRSTTVTP